MKKIEWAGMTERGQVAALEEFFVRVDELNEHALSLTRQAVMSRLLDLNEDLFDAFGDGDETPGTLRIRTALGAERVQDDALLPDVSQERPFTQQGGS